MISWCSVKAYIHQCLRLGSSAAAMQPYVKDFGKKLCATLKVDPNPDNARYFPSLDKIHRTCAKEIRSMRMHQVSMLEGRESETFVWCAWLKKGTADLCCWMRHNFVGLTLTMYRYL